MENKIKISKFQVKDLEEVKNLLTVTITQNFKNNNIVSKKELDAEIKAQIKLVIDYINKKDTCMNMFSAKLNEKIIGVVAYGAQTPKINKHIEEQFKNVLEIKNLYILPEYQKMGLGKKLFLTACENLLKNNYSHFMLYSSFKTGQTYWQKMLGEPYKTIFDSSITRKVWLQEIKI